jgi:hypothetical protein
MEIHRPQFVLYNLFYFERDRKVGMLDIQSVNNTLFYILAFFIVGLASKNVSDKFKSIARCSLQDMFNVERTSVLQVLLRIGLWPFKNWGLLAVF